MSELCILQRVELSGSLFQIFVLLRIFSSILLVQQFEAFAFIEEFFGERVES